MVNFIFTMTPKIVKTRIRFEISLFLDLFKNSTKMLIPSKNAPTMAVQKAAKAICAFESPSQSSPNEKSFPFLFFLSSSFFFFGFLSGFLSSFGGSEFSSFSSTTSSA